MPTTSRSNKKIFVGIDPGKSGGIAIIWSESRVELIPMPETEKDLHQSITFLGASKLTNVVACIELVHSMPKMSSQSMFEFGKQYGKCLMWLAVLGVPYHLPTPQQWMKGLKIPSVKGEKYNDRKKRLRAICQRLYPSLTIWDGPMEKQKSVCDALLIATYCKETYQ